MSGFRLSCFAVPPPCSFPSRAHARRPLDSPVWCSASVSDISAAVTPGPAPRFWRPRRSVSGGSGGGRNHSGGGGGGGGGGNGEGEGDKSGSNLFQTLVSFYASALASRPLLTKIITATVIALVSDAIAQHLQGQPWSAARAIPFAMATAAVSAPMYHTSFSFLESALPATCARNIAAQLAVDQLLLAPLWIVLFTSATVVLDKAADALRRARAPFATEPVARNPAEAVSLVASTTASRLRNEFWPLLKLTWYMFPIIQGFNIALVPLQWRVAVLNSADLVFTVGLSMITHDHPHGAPAGVTASADMVK